MSAASSQASAFYEQIAKNGIVFTLTSEGDYLVFPVAGREVVPFWSSRSRLDNVQKTHPKYSGYTVSEEPLTEFLDATLSLFEEEGICVGVNWSGTRLVGYDLRPEEIRRNVEYWLSKPGADG